MRNPPTSRPPGRVRRGLALLLVTALAGSALSLVTVPAAPPTPAAAEPGNPGTPGEPALIYEEDFENTDDGTNILLADYTGSDGMTYTSDEFWQDRNFCNGFIADQTSPRLDGDCNGDVDEANGRRIYQWVTGLAEALGEHDGATDPSLNGAASAFTAGDGPANEVQFRTADPISLDVENRFVTFSVDAVAMNCQAPDHTQLRFYLEDADGEQPMSGAAVDPCSDPRATAIVGNTQNGTELQARIGSFPGDRSVLLSGGEFGIVLRNEDGGGYGNDGAYDNIRVLDVTPQLDKSFGPESALVDGTSTLTFTVTNTSELGAKNGWSFTDNLPEGLVAAEPATIGGNCTADTTVGDDGTTISVANGQLAAGAESCTITVDVTSGTAGEYENCADDISDPVGLDLPGCASVTFEPQRDFSCSPNGILFQYPNGPTRVYSVDMVTGRNRVLGDIKDRSINAVGFNSLDNYLYGIDRAHQLVRIGKDLSVVELGWPEGLSIGVTADVDDEGQYWLLSESDESWYKIDLAPGSDDYGQVVDTGTSPMPSGAASGADWAYIPGTDALWSLGTRGDDVVLVKFDRSTQQRSVTAEFGALGGNTFGAVYADPSGFLYGSDNVTGQIFRVDVAAGTVKPLSPGPSSTYNDGARCSEAPIPIDFGDAPDGYGTALADDGPRHSIPGYDVENNTAPLMLGTKIDIETDAAPSPDAVGDDSTDLADEDGVPGPLQLAQTGSNTVSVTATNDTDQAATLAGWIDLDRSGTFDDNESVTVPVAAGSGSAAYSLKFGEATGSGSAYARFRLFAGEVAEPSPTGPAAAGEVEDYVADARALSIEKTSDATDSTRIGDPVTYTVTVTNTGTVPFTDDDPAIATDDLSGLLDDATYREDAKASSGEVSVDGSRLTWRGGIEPGDSVTITYSVTVTGEGDSELTNVAFQPTCDPTDEECEPVTPPAEVCAEDGLDPKTGLPCDSTSRVLAKLSVQKTADPADGEAVEADQEVTYSLRFKNTGEADAPVKEWVDDLSDVLDDAELVSGPEASDESLSVSKITDGRFTVDGSVAAGATVTVSYTVAVRSWDEQGDHLLANFVTAPGEEPPADTCPPDSDRCTSHPTDEPPAEPELPQTGAPTVTWPLVGGLMLVLAGGLAIGRRNRIGSR